jgi:hypothetical protein
MSRIVGSWRLIRSEAIGPSEPVIMEFDPTGALTYSILLGDRTQIFKLTYEIDGDAIVTDQPSAPRKERTRFSIDPNGLLELEKADERTWYERV